jgi:hypothetical protein
LANKAKQELWRERIKSFQASGLSRKEWCQKHDFPENQLGYWLRKLQAKEIEPGSNLWVAVEANCLSETGISIQIGDVVLAVKRGFDHQVLADVVRALMRVC